MLAPIVIGAVVAGISALVKSAVERRDARLSAERQLGLATSRTAFVKEWLAVSNTVGDPIYAQGAAVRAKADLDQAYKEANEALARGQSAIEESWGDRLVDELRWVLLIRERHTAASVASWSRFTSSSSSCGQACSNLRTGATSHPCGKT